MSFSSSPVREYRTPAIFAPLQPSSPTQIDDDVPADFDASFASSMSITMSPMLSPILDASPMDISPLPTSFLQVPRRPMLAAIQPAYKENARPAGDYFNTKPSGTKSEQAKQSSQAGRTRKFGTDLANLPRTSLCLADKSANLPSPAAAPSPLKNPRARAALPAQWMQKGANAEKRRGGLFERSASWALDSPQHYAPASSSPVHTDRMDIDSSSPALASHPFSPCPPALAQPHAHAQDETMSPPPAVIAASSSNLSDLSALYDDGRDLPSSPLVQKQKRKPSPPIAKPLLPAALSDLPSSSPPTSPTVALKARKLEKYATTGTGSLLFGVGASRAPTLSSRRPHPYARRPSINPSAPERDSLKPLPPPPQSAFSILTQEPECLRAPGPPAITGPMRRALSMAGAEELSSDDPDPDVSASVSGAGSGVDGSPLAQGAAQRAYARRTNTRIVTRADGSPAFRPFRGPTDPVPREPVSAVEKRQSEGGHGIGPRMAGLGGMPEFGHNEAEGKILPCHKVKDDGLMRITPDTLESVLNGDYDEQLQALHIVDCRFDYEFSGGHIDGAVNLGTTEAVEAYFLRSGCGLALPTASRSGEVEQGEKKTVIIFHCEFSVKRAPTIAKHLRSRDRAQNAHVYPKVHFPEVYILHGGYFDFHKRCPAHCEPKGYVAMLDPRHAGSCSPSLGQFRAGSRWQRARSYTYGDSGAGGMQRPKNAGLPFAAAAVAVAVRKRRAGLTAVKEDQKESHLAGSGAGSASQNRSQRQREPSSSDDQDADADADADAFGFGNPNSPCPPPSMFPRSAKGTMFAPPPVLRQAGTLLDGEARRPRSLGAGRNVFERAVSFR